jgi:hypothetical protein
MGPACLARGGSPETVGEKDRAAPDGAGVGHGAWVSLTRRVSISTGLEAHRTGREPGKCSVMKRQSNSLAPRLVADVRRLNNRGAVTGGGPNR